MFGNKIKYVCENTSLRRPCKFCCFCCASNTGRRRRQTRTDEAGACCGCSPCQARCAPRSSCAIGTNVNTSAAPRTARSNPAVPQPRRPCQRGQRLRFCRGTTTAMPAGSTARGSTDAVPEMQSSSQRSIVHPFQRYERPDGEHGQKHGSRVRRESLAIMTLAPRLSTRRRTSGKHVQGVQGRCSGALFNACWR